MRLPLKKIISVGCQLSAFLLLSGCILVEDFGSAWNKAKPDPCLSKLAEAIYYSEFRRDPEGKNIDALARGWDLDGQHYLMLKKAPEDIGGRLYRFRVQSGVFQRYRLNPVMRETFAKDYPQAPVTIARDTATIPNLTPEVGEVLARVANNPDYWEIEDQALYNIYLNPLCRFDDRNVRALIEENKPKAKK